jgi:hypothetical protein
MNWDDMNIDFIEFMENHDDKVKIKVNGKEYQGRVVGKRLKFPLVWVRALDRDIEFSRRAIHYAITTGSVLIA